MLGYHLTGLCLRFFTGGEGRAVGTSGNEKSGEEIPRFFILHKGEGLLMHK